MHYFNLKTQTKSPFSFKTSIKKIYEIKMVLLILIVLIGLFHPFMAYNPNNLNLRAVNSCDLQKLYDFNGIQTNALYIFVIGNFRNHYENYRLFS